MPAVLLEDERELLANELRARHTPLPGGAREKPIDLGFECDRLRLLLLSAIEEMLPAATELSRIHVRDSGC